MSCIDDEPSPHSITWLVALGFIDSIKEKAMEHAALHAVLDGPHGAVLGPDGCVAAGAEPGTADQVPVVAGGGRQPRSSPGRVAGRAEAGRSGGPRETSTGDEAT